MIYKKVRVWNATADERWERRASRLFRGRQGGQGWECLSIFVRALIGHLPGSVASCRSCRRPGSGPSDPTLRDYHGGFAAIEAAAEGEYQPETGAAEPQWRNFSASISILTGLLRKSSIPA